MKGQLEAETQANVPEESVLGSIEQVLEYYDLRPMQIRVYLQLAKAGPQPAIAVARKLGIHRTESYKILRELGGLGLVLMSVERPTKYKALSFRTAICMMWEEKKSRMDAIQLVGEALIRAWESVPTVPDEEKTNPLIFTCFQTGLFKRKIEAKARESETRLYYLTEDALSHLGQQVEGDGFTVNTGHLELGSFIAFDDSVFLVSRNQLEKWGALEIHVPEVVSAYKHLYRLLEAKA